MRQNATDLTEVGSIADVDAANGRWYWDAANDRLYVRTTTGSNPDSFTVMQGFVRLHLSTTGIVLNRTTTDGDTGVYYHPWLTEESEAAIEQVGDSLFAVKTSSTALLAIANQGALWQRITASNGGWHWKNRRARIYVGGRVRGVDIPRENYAQFLSMLIDDVGCAEPVVRIILRPRALQLDMQLPRTPIFTSEYPNLGEGVSGNHKPLIYGRLTLSPYLIDTTVSQGQYLVADAAYQTLKAVHNVWAVALDTGARTLLTLTTDYTVDLTACTITVVNATYNYASYSIAAEVTGKPDANGKAIETAASIVKDLLTTHLGATDSDLDLDSFTDAEIEAPELLTVGLLSRRTIGSILMTSEQGVPSLERSVLAVLRETAGGRWQFKVRSFLLAETTAELGQRDFAAFDPEPSYESAFSKTHVFYAFDASIDTWKVETYTDTRAAYLLDDQGVGAANDGPELHTYLRNQADAETLARRYQLIAGGIRMRIAFLERSAKLYRALVGDQFAVTYTPAPDASGAFIGETLELTEIRKSVAPTLGTRGMFRDLRGLTGWVWGGDDEPLDWAAATAAQRRRLGFWADDNGEIVPGDASTRDIRRWV